MKKYKPGDLLVNERNKGRYIVVTTDEWCRWMEKENNEPLDRSASEYYLALIALRPVRGLHDRFTYVAYPRDGIGENFFTKIEI